MTQLDRKITEAKVIADIAEGEELARRKRIEIEQFLDEMNLERLEWDRLQHDMYPGAVQETEDE